MALPSPTVCLHSTAKCSVMDVHLGKRKARSEAFKLCTLGFVKYYSSVVEEGDNENWKGNKQVALPVCSLISAVVR